MALLITDECINCGACLPECPNEAIFETRSDAESKGNHVGDGQGVGDNIYVITHDRCTECVGHFDEPQCAAVCPVDNCCISDPAYPEGSDVLLEKARHSILTSLSIRQKFGAACGTDRSTSRFGSTSERASTVMFALV